jgi:hypothetical protein
MHQSPYWDAVCCSACHKNSPFMKFKRSLPNSQVAINRLYLELNVSSLHITNTFLNHFDDIFPPTPPSPKSSHSFATLHYNRVPIYHRHHICYMPLPPHSPWFTDLLMFGEVQIWIFSLCKFLSVPHSFNLFTCYFWQQGYNCTGLGSLNGRGEGRGFDSR